MNGGEELEIIVTAILVGICVYTDLRYYRIYNKVLLIGLLSGCLYNVITEGLFLAMKGLIGLLIPFFLLFPFFCLRAIGAGDIKLLCVIAQFLTPKQTITFLIVSFMAGGVLSICKMILEKNGKDRIKTFFFYLKKCFQTKKIDKYQSEWKASKEQKKAVIHFSIPIAIATIFWIGGSI